jgi:hypothetical protein
LKGVFFGNKSLIMGLKLVKELDLRKNDTILESTTCGRAAKTSVAFRPCNAFKVQSTETKGNCYGTTYL